MTQGLSPDKETPRFPVVGIGASAGGLDAYKKFFTRMPADSGAAFVLVPHLDPTHASLMVELLARQTQMPVCEAEDGMQVEPNCVYVIPPNKYLAFIDRHLQLSVPAERHAEPTAIDFFFNSLALDHGESAVGIILSGTSNHGTAGLKDIKLAGGMLMVQQPESAEYDQMPRSAIATGLVDVVLPPEEMPDALMRYLQHPYASGAMKEAEEDTERAQLESILNLLRTQSKFDFQAYRKNMLLRRVHRRMGLCHIEQLSEYLDYLRNTPDELTALLHDLMIGVTFFFRDPEAFQVLQQRVIPDLIQRSRVRGIRIWCPACASGEEAYTLAMLFTEQFVADSLPIRLQIFATDINEEALQFARHGVYHESNLAVITPERLERFFVRVDEHHWQINKQVREAITFAPQNLITDAPFSKLDLVSCRNLLIYLEPEVQAKVIRLFHFALAESGYMLLGSSESIGRDSDLFEPVSKKWRVFRRIDLARRDLVEFPIISTGDRRTPRFPQPETATVPLTRFKDLMQRVVLNEYVPAAALINSKHEILCVLGPLADFLEFPSGEMTKDLLAMARPGLRTRIRAALHKAIETRETVIDRDARVKRDGNFFYCSVTVKPLIAVSEASGLLLITFQNRDRPLPSTAVDTAQTPDESVFVQQLELELKSTREDLQSTIEQHEDSTEELKASNEEMLSMNEELQSANEELEASKEELQSLTEELNTVNNQLQDKVEELDRSNSDLINLIDGSEVATVFLDTQLQINRFTPHSAKLLNLKPSDMGRRFSDFAPRFTDITLLDDCRKVLKQGKAIEKEVWSISEEPESRCYLRRALPYKSKDDHIEGVLITFVDITSRMVAESQTRRLASVLWASNDAVIVHDFTGRIISWNRGAEVMFGYSAEEALQVNARDLAPAEKSDEVLTYTSSLRNDIAVPAFETQRLTKDGRVLDVELSVTAYRDERGELIGVATTERDVTQRKRTAAVLYETEERSKAVLNTATDAIITINHRGLIVTVNPATEHMFGYSQEELLGQNIRLLMHSPDREEHDGYINRYVETEEARMIGIGREVKGLRKDGETLEIDLAVSRIDHLGLFTGILRDITPRKQLQKQVLEIADEEQRRIGQELHDGTGQELTGLSLFAGTLVDMLHDAPKNSNTEVESWLLTEDDLQRIRQTATRLSEGIVEAHHHVQQLSHGIMPMQIEVEGLTAALAELANSTNVEQKLRCRFDNPTPVVVANKTTATHLYRIAQEAVNNAVRHSRADQISITLSSGGDKIVLEVIDNGVGIRQAPAMSSKTSGRPSGFGLEIMDYRAGIIGGQLRVTRRDSGGTSVRCVVRARGES